MQKHKRKQSEMNPPTSHNIQTQLKAFPTNMQTTRQAINNTNHPSSALKAKLLDLLFLIICPKTPRQPHLHIRKQLVKRLTTPITCHHRSNQLFELLFLILCPKTPRQPHLLVKRLTTPITYHHRFNQLFDLIFFMICAKALRPPHLHFKLMFDLITPEIQHTSRGKCRQEEKTYIEDELLASLDLLEPPENFIEHQWRVYKSHLRKPIAKVIAYREISSKVKDLVGPESIAEDVVVA
uniref:Uncharacterized protein n=1 Tax=Tanacetum cinerariifolium TaxID=118510 RepID=A0A699I2Y4_TANCI|nr:hypothetical protein [Tanacetum cinerariifolium]